MMKCYGVIFFICENIYHNQKNMLKMRHKNNALKPANWNIGKLKHR